MKLRSLAALFAALAGSFTSRPALASDAPGAPTLGPSATIDVSALAASKERLYVGAFDQGLYVLEDGRTLRPVVEPALSRHINALAWSEREQVLWVGSARGLARCPLGKSCARLGPEGGVHALAISASGAVIAGGDAGLVFVEGERVQSYGKKDGAPFRSVWALAEAGGRLFAGTTNGLFWGAPAAFSGARAELGRAAVVLDTLPDDWVTALNVNGDTVVAGTYSAGIVEFRITGKGLVPGERDPRLGYVNPAGITRVDDGCVAVATMDGLELGLPNRTALIPTRARDVTAFVRDPNGGFWIGTRAGIERFTGTCSAANAASAASRK